MRTLANGLIDAYWWNRPVKDIHVGQLGSSPLLRRVTVREEQRLMRITPSRMIYGLRSFSAPHIDPDPRP